MSEPARVSSRQILLLAVWAGLLAGVLESLIAIALQQAGWPIRVSVEILWIAPAFNLALFLVVGVTLALVAPMPLFASHGQLALVILLWMLGFGLLQVPDAMRPGAAFVLALGLAIAARRRLQAVERWLRLVRRSVAPLAVAASVCMLTGLVWPSWREGRMVEALARPRANLPNVLLVTLDTLRADHMSAYGYSRSTTPHLDQLARQGVLFEHAFANSSWTLPAHASLLTGRYPHEHGADWLKPMDGRIMTLAEMLAARGYVTAAFAANTSYVAPQWGLGRGFSHFEVYGTSLADDAVRTAWGRRLALNVLPRLGYFDIPGRKRASQLNRQFLAWLDRIEPRPFFALLNYLDVHDPYVTVDSHHTRYSPQAAKGDVINFQFQPHAFRRKPTLSAAEIQAEIDAYDGCLAYLDSELGALFSELVRRGLDSNTLVVVTSDHGESFGNHNLFGHGNSVYLETLRVPLLIVWPGEVPAGLRVSQPVGLERLPVTIGGLVDPQTGPGPFPGHSLAALWTTPDAAAEPILSEVSRVSGGPSGYPTSGGSLTSLVTRDWHLVVSATGATELYAWPRDPNERVNLAESQQGLGVVAELTRAMRQMTTAGTP